MKVRNYEDLDVWNKGIEIVDKVYQLTERFPRSESYNLVVQMQKASVSKHRAEEAKRSNGAL